MAQPMTDIPIWLGNALGISTTNAAFIISAAILVSIAMCIALLSKGKMDTITIAVPMIATMGVLVAIAWLPYWILLVLAILIAIQFGGKIREWGK